MIQLVANQLEIAMTKPVLQYSSLYTTSGTRRIDIHPQQIVLEKYLEHEDEKS